MKIKKYLKSGAYAALICTMMISITNHNARSYADDLSNEVKEQQRMEELNVLKAEDGIEVMKELKNEVIKNGFKFEINKNLSSEEIAQKFEEISEKYGLYETISDEDQEFIVAYSYLPGEDSSYTNENLRAGINQTATLKQVKSTQYGVTATLYGTLSQKGGGAFDLNNYYGGNVKMRILGGASKVNTIERVIKHTSWGIAGENGVIKTYDGKIEDIKRTGPFANSDFNRNEHYYAYTSAMSTSTKMIINTKTGSFQLNGTL